MIPPDVARSYREQGLCVLPAMVAHKRPAIGSWKSFQTRLPTASEVDAWFAGSQDGCCLVCGMVSGNLEIIDFDGRGILYDEWREIVARETTSLLERLVIERTPSGGLHIVYRCTEPVSGNQKLAQRSEVLDSGDPVKRFDKTVSPRRGADGRWSVVSTLIETRGEGGLCLCAPSTDYELIQNDFAHLPVLTADERDVLLRAAWALNEVLPEPIAPPAQIEQGHRPGDEFNERADVAELLSKHGWTLVRDGENQHWSRPGKGESTSATLRRGTFYVFSSNAAPFEAHRAYRPFSVYALLEHQGNFRAAASALRQLGLGKTAMADEVVDLSGLLPDPSGNLPFDFHTFAETPDGNVRWLWPGVIARGMVSLIGGKQGLGKSFLICDLAARLSSGQPLPDGTVNPPGRVLLLAREDDASCVLLPRLRAAKADLTRVSWSLFHATAGSQQCIDLATHAGLLTRAVSERGIDLIVVDTFAAFAPAGTDANAAQDVRVLLDALARLARDSGVAVVVVAHLRKTGQADGDPMDAIAGSAQMTAGVRVASMLEKGSRDDERRFFVVKSNLGPTNTRGWTWRFVIGDPFVDGVTEMPHLEWAPALAADAPVDAPPVPDEDSTDELVRQLIVESLVTRPRSQNDLIDLVGTKLRQHGKTARKAQVRGSIAAMLDDGRMVSWDGPRGAKFVGMPGSEQETPEAKALQLARAEPDITADELRRRAGCRKETACDALKRVRSE